MTSPINHNETMEFFKSNRFFGLPESDVLIFEQGMLPCLTREGKIIMESASRVAMAPDGYVEAAPVGCARE
jgi:UDP-N-acetylglucosamine/UDP-N-acetylgalactosamine diphosphorylase